MDIKNLKLELLKLKEENKVLKHKLDISYFLPIIVFQVAELMEFHAKNQQNKYPFNSQIYIVVSQLLRFHSNPDTVKYSVREILAENKNFKPLIDRNKLHKLKDFNAIMLIDLVTKMQIMEKDNSFEDALKYIEKLNENIAEDNLPINHNRQDPEFLKSR